MTRHGFDAAFERHRLAAPLSQAIDALPEQPTTTSVPTYRGLGHAW